MTNGMRFVFALAAILVLAPSAAAIGGGSLTGGANTNNQATYDANTVTDNAKAQADAAAGSTTSAATSATGDVGAQTSDVSAPGQASGDATSKVDVGSEGGS